MPYSDQQHLLVMEAFLAPNYLGHCQSVSVVPALEFFANLHQASLIFHFSKPRKNSKYRKIQNNCRPYFCRLAFHFESN